MDWGGGGRARARRVARVTVAVGGDVLSVTDRRHADDAATPHVVSSDRSPPRRPLPGLFSRDEWQRLESLMDALLDAPAADRAALLTELSAGDSARRSELARLVAECEREDRLLDRPAAERFSALVDDPPGRRIVPP